MTIHIQVLGSDENRDLGFNTLIDSGSDFCPIDIDEYFIYNEDDLKILRAEKISFKILGRE